jgi:hypothetical protein
MVPSDSLSKQTPVTATDTNFDNEDLDLFYDAINPDDEEKEQEEFYDALEYFEVEKQTSCSEKRSFDSISKDDKAVANDSLSNGQQCKRLEKKLKATPKSAKSSCFFSFAAMSEHINSGSKKTSIAQDDSSKNENKENNNLVPSPVSMAPVSMAPISIASVPIASVPIARVPIEPVHIVSVLSEKRKLEHADHEEATSNKSLKSSQLQTTSGVSKNEKTLKKIKAAPKSSSSLIDDLRAAINKNAPTTRPRTLRRVAEFHSQVRLVLPPITEKHGKYIYIYILKKKYQHDLLYIAFCGFQNEATICQADAQLFVLDKRQRWRKRATGNVVLDKDNEQARLAMLDDTTFRPILDLKLFFGMKAYVSDNCCIHIDSFDTVHDIYGRPVVKLVRYALKVDDAHTANNICNNINSQTPSLPATIPKEVLHDAINKDVCSVISALISEKNPWKL